MRSLFETGASICLAFFLATGTLSAEVLDRVAVTVDKQVITEQELFREIRLNAFLNKEQPDYSTASLRRAASRLIEQKLVYNEMALGRYPQADEKEAADMLAKLEKARARSHGDFERDLKAAGISAADLKDHLVWGLTLSHFVDLRFRPAVQVTGEDVQKYYAEHVVGDGKTGQKVTLDDVREQIQQALTGERADKQMDEWLKEARARSQIDFKKSVFSDAPAGAVQ